MLVHRSTRNQAELLFQVRLLWRTACWHPHHLARGEITVFTYNSLRGPVCYSIRSPSSPIRHLQPLTCGPETAKTDSLHEYWTSHISVTVPEQHIYTHTFHGLFWKKKKKTNKQTKKKNLGIFTNAHYFMDCSHNRKHLRNCLRYPAWEATICRLDWTLLHFHSSFTPFPGFGFPSFTSFRFQTPTPSFVVWMLLLFFVVCALYICYIY